MYRKFKRLLELWDIKDPTKEEQEEFFELSHYYNEIDLLLRVN